MLSKNNRLIKTFRSLIYIAPAALFFSYYPNIHFGSNSSMNFELSLPLIWLVIFDLFSLILLIKNRSIKNIPKYWPWLLLPAYLTISILWSLGSLRGILVAGIIWLLYFAGFALYELKKYLNTDNIKSKFYKIFFYSTLIICLWCWVQSILDLIGISRDQSLMCPGCVTAMFGFPHPNGFAIEPQFMGNLLLAPCLVSMYFLLKNSHWKRWLLFFIFTATLFLTFSRGAIYAFIAAAIFLTIYYIVYTKSARALALWPVIIIAFLFTLNFQGIFAKLSPTSDTYLSGISKSLNHLSLGLIDVRPTETTTPSSEPGDSTDAAVFDGYVASSTDTRVNLNDFALAVWRESPTTILFGTGLGSAGEALYVSDYISHPKEIVQNQYFGLLLETGLVGIALFILTIILVVRAVFKTSLSGPIYALLIAYAISLCFFAGLPNALHIYLLPAILLAFEKS